MRNTFIFYRSFYEAISELPTENQAEIFKAICEFSLNFKEPELSGISKTIWILIKPNLEANNKRFENGKQPKQKQNTSKKEAKDKQNGSKTKANKDKDKDVDKDNNKDNNTPLTPKGEFDFDKFLNWFNETTGKKIRTIDKKTRGQINARLKEGYNKTDISKAVKNCMNDSFHIETNLKHLTPEFISRADKLSKYASIDKPKGQNYILID